MYFLYRVKHELLHSRSKLTRNSPEAPMSSFRPEAYLAGGFGVYPKLNVCLNVCIITCIPS